MSSVYLHLAHQLRVASKRSAEYSERHFFALGLITLIAMPLTTFIERMVVDPSYDTLYIRCIAAALAPPLLFHRQLTGFLKRHFEIYWVCGVTYAIPFSFGLMLILNAAYTPPTESVSSIWIYQYIVALFFFIQLIHHGGLTILLWVIASIATFLSLLFVTEPNWEQVAAAALIPLPIYITTILIGSFTNRNIYAVQAEKIKAVAAIGSNIAHELRTPLASIRSLSRGIRNHLGILIDGYEQARLANLPVKPLNDRRNEALRNALASIEEEVGYSNTIIDMLLVNTGNVLHHYSGTETTLASACIKDAIERFPFNNAHEKQLVRTETAQDFPIRLPRLLVVHLLFNLIKNALYQVQHSGKGDIVLRLQINTDSATIKVHDTGPGIRQDQQRQIFDRFYTTTGDSFGTGIGLSFCKTVMESVGGNITCQSVEGEYTTFNLIFPKSLCHIENSD